MRDVRMHKCERDDYNGGTEWKEERREKERRKREKRIWERRRNKERKERERRRRVKC